MIIDKRDRSDPLSMLDLALRALPSSSTGLFVQIHSRTLTATALTASSRRLLSSRTFKITSSSTRWNIYEPNIASPPFSSYSRPSSPSFRLAQVCPLGLRLPCPTHLYYLSAQVYRAFSSSSSTTNTNMPPIFNKPTVETYDYIVVGGGSGGSGTSVSCF